MFYQVIHNRVARQINSGYKIYPDEWDIFNSQIIIPAKTGENRHRYLVSLKKCIEEDTSRLKDIMIRSRYGEFPKISFDYEVAEKAQSVAVVPFAGEWKDLGTWNTLTDELSEHTMGNVVMDEESENTHVINELGLPIMCIGTRNLVIAASNDGILISDKDKSENIKTYADCLQHRPMFEERRWGEYKVVDTAEFSDGYKSLTKQLKIKSGKSISYQVHRHRDEVWTFIDGEGELVLDDIRSVISRGDTITIKKGVKHAVRAISELTFIEVQSGNLLAEEDIEQFDYKW